MSIFELLIAISAIGVIIYGGVRVRNLLKEVKLGTVSGALVVMLVFTRYMVYAAVVGISLFFILSFFFSEAPPPPIYQHAFKIQLIDPAYSISDLAGAVSDLASIRDLRGNVNIVGADWVVYMLAAITYAGIVALLHWILIYAEQVLRSLGLRKPFTQENALYTRRISLLMLCLWFIYSGFQLLMTLYLQSKLQLEGVQLQMSNISLFQSLFVVGLVYVLAEVFRVGYELKQDQSLTV